MSVNQSTSSKRSMNYADIMASILNQNYRLVKEKRESEQQSMISSRK